MPIEFTPVTDNSLLPFATEGGAMVPQGDDNYGSWFELTGIFENGLTLGDDTYTGLRVNTNGDIQFGNGQGYQNTFIRGYRDDLDTRTIPDGVENSGIWIDENAARDSVTITWNAVPRYFRNTDLLSTFQVEILDRGNSDAEVIFRYDDIQTRSFDNSSFFDSYFRFDGATIRAPLSGLNVPAREWGDIEGNTGIDGVWQFRFEDGTLDAEDRTIGVAFRREIGTEAADMLEGWLGNDILRGLGGDDLLEGFFGNDSMTGDAGDDTILGGSGDDIINGGDGADSIQGGSGNDLIGAGTGGAADTVAGGAGNDTIVAGDGANRILGEDGNDDISVGDGADAIDGGDGRDTINGGGGDDTLQGGGWDDTVHGGDGADLILGHSGWDYLTGGLGDDTILGGQGNDSILGAEGNDSINVGDGRDTVLGGAGDDVILATASPGARYYYYYGNGNEMNGGDGADSITGGRFDDTIGGQDGDDVIDGNGGNNRLGGGLGDDDIRGGDWDQAGNDFIFGGEGADSLMGGGGNDTLFGSEGNDTILGSFGRDVILGGDGDDFIFGGEGYDLATGGAGADSFFASTEETDVTVITDYDPDEGDVLILDGELFSADNLRLRGDRLTDLSGNPAEFRSLELVYLGEDRELEQTVFAFSNATELDRVIIRLPLPDEAGQIIDLPLF